MTKVYKYEDGTALRFFYDTAKNNYQSEQHGRAVFDKTLKVEVLAPGSKESIPVFTCITWVTQGYDEEGTPIVKEKRNETYCERYRRQLLAFVEDSDDPEMQGTSIDGWGGLDITLVETLKEAKVYTVEALANIPDSKLQALGPGIRSLRTRAQTWLTESKGGAGMSALAARVTELEEEQERTAELVQSAEAIAKENAELKQQVESLKADLALADQAPAPAPTRTAGKTKV